ncbi:GNAT family N-acetyltransferase [Clostridium sp. ZS2-4]|uniref:GNAT family N-acetyltransferase n=1 Tax=Clostridium sp. ZS2-4 TaxID=2987703 RepID=UPI00227A23A0|nr:GNAT family N-acetyltransferase [Clostridium sp. ZS2-4]MCY6354136.1 GNAT family N-acetyltransferase [Clostridium sp. ZS2-4]
MNNSFVCQIKVLKIDELERALALVYDVFMEFEAPDYSEQGIKAFEDFIELNSIKNMIEDNILNFWVCYDREEIVGVISTKEVSHICMLFVDKNYHRKGIARNLFKTILSNIENNHKIKEITVNSSPYAVEFYHKLGFQDTSSEQTVDGIRFTPMKLQIREWGKCNFLY